MSFTSKKEQRYLRKLQKYHMRVYGKPLPDNYLKNQLGGNPDPDEFDGEKQEIEKRINESHIKCKEAMKILEGLKKRLKKAEKNNNLAEIKLQAAEGYKNAHNELIATREQNIAQLQNQLDGFEQQLEDASIVITKFQELEQNRNELYQKSPSRVKPYWSHEEKNARAAYKAVDQEVKDKQHDFDMALQKVRELKEEMDRVENFKKMSKEGVEAMKSPESYDKLTQDVEDAQSEKDEALQLLERIKDEFTESTEKRNSECNKYGKNKKDMRENDQKEITYFKDQVEKKFTEASVLAKEAIDAIEASGVAYSESNLLKRQIIERANKVQPLDTTELERQKKESNDRVSACKRTVNKKLNELRHLKNMTQRPIIKYIKKVEAYEREHSFNRYDTEKEQIQQVMTKIQALIDSILGASEEEKQRQEDLLKETQEFKKSFAPEVTGLWNSMFSTVKSFASAAYNAANTMAQATGPGGVDDDDDDDNPAPVGPPSMEDRLKSIGSSSILLTRIKALGSILGGSSVTVNNPVKNTSGDYVVKLTIDNVQLTDLDAQKQDELKDLIRNQYCAELAIDPKSVKVELKSGSIIVVVTILAVVPVILTPSTRVAVSAVAVKSKNKNINYARPEKYIGKKLPFGNRLISRGKTVRFFKKEIVWVSDGYSIVDFGRIVGQISENNVLDQFHFLGLDDDGYPVRTYDVQLRSGEVITMNDDQIYHGFEVVDF